MLLHLWRRWLPLTTLLTTLIFTSTVWAETLKSHECYENFAAALEQVKHNLPLRFGPDWKMDSVPPEIAGELQWITGASDGLRSKSDTLDSRASHIHAEESELETASKWLGNRANTLKSKYEDLARRAEALDRDWADLEARGKMHNANQCKYVEGHYTCGAYDAEKTRLEGEAAALQRRKEALLREQQELDHERDGLQSEAEALGQRQARLQEAKANLNSDISSYTEGCETATARAQALSEILNNRPARERLPDAKPDANAQVVKSFGQEAAVQSYEQLALPVLEKLLKPFLSKGALKALGPGPGITLAALDVAHAGMDEKTKEVTNNVFLIGEYATALKRLQQQGRLNANDPGYQALMGLQTKLGGEAPTSAGEFTWQSLTSMHTLLNGVSSAAGQYASKVTGEMKLGNKIWSHLTPEDKKVLGKNGAAFFKPLLTRTFGGSSSLLTEEALKTVHEGIKEQRKEWSEQKTKER